MSTAKTIKMVVTDVGQRMSAVIGQAKLPKSRKGFDVCCSDRDGWKEENGRSKMVRLREKRAMRTI